MRNALVEPNLKCKLGQMWHKQWSEGNTGWPRSIWQSRQLHLHIFVDNTCWNSSLAMHRAVFTCSDAPIILGQSGCSYSILLPPIEGLYKLSSCYDIYGDGELPYQMVRYAWKGRDTLTTAATHRNESHKPFNLSHLRKLNKETERCEGAAHAVGLPACIRVTESLHERRSKVQRTRIDNRHVGDTPLQEPLPDLTFDREAMVTSYKIPKVAIMLPYTS